MLPFRFGLAGFRAIQFAALGIPSAPVGNILFRSTDGGDSWYRLRISEDSSAIFPEAILYLSFHPRERDTIYLGTKSSGLWKSINGGATWHQVTDARKILDPFSSVYKIAVSRENPEIIYLSVFQNDRNSILKSEDGGKSFQTVYFPSLENTSILDLINDPTASTHVFILTSRKTIVESLDGGATWRVRHQFDEMPTHIFLNDRAPDILYLLTSKGNIWKSEDSGNRWTDIGIRQQEESGRATAQIKIPPDLFSDILLWRKHVYAVDSTNPFTLYFSSRAGVFRSRNAGASWEKLIFLEPMRGAPVESLAVSSRHPSSLFAAIKNQIHESADGGVSWRMRILPKDGRIEKLYLDPLRPEIMFAVFKE